MNHFGDKPSPSLNKDTPLPVSGHTRNVYLKR